jgi:3(or 17)beta-hydroxysteroid dehydrogenase
MTTPTSKVALVTGGAGGLGRAMCARLVADGFRVGVADLDATRAQAVAAKIGPQALGIALDVTSEASWVSALTQLQSAFGPMDVLVNNAGYLNPANIEDLTLEDWQRTQRINGDGVFLGCKSAVAAMKQRGGVIINMSSTMGVRGMPKHPAYSASKAAVRLLTQSVAKHCGEQGYKIRVVAVLPGAVETDMLRKNIPATMSEADYFAEVRARHPVGRIGTPDDIAAAISFLVSDQASFITGTDFVVDGGSSM